MILAKIEAASIAALIGALSMFVLGALSYFNTRKTTEGTATKDIIEAGSLARKDLAEEVLRMGRVVDELQGAHQRMREVAVTERASCDEQLAGLHKAMELERARRTLLEETSERERGWSDRMMVVLREHGIPVPERGGAP